jgi:hypothetical protein
MELTPQIFPSPPPVRGPTTPIDANVFERLLR